MPLSLEVVTAERLLLDEGGIDVVIAPAIDGEIAILPEHAPLITPLAPGEMRIRRGGEENSYFVSGGFLEVLRDKVTVLADAAEHAEEIDVARADEARRRAQESLAHRHDQPDVAAAEAALRRSLIRLRVAERRRRSRPGPGAPQGRSEF
jgi:F-type H+-transporting ATPase subunit epsilon